MEKVIAVFDIGKTNKKILLFNSDLKVAYEREDKFPVITDDDGFECDDIKALENWIIETLKDLSQSEEYSVKAVNFSTYGASLMYLDENGRALTPLYNYLKPMPDSVLEGFYERYGGIEEFSRKTASPALGYLNSGLQILWLKKEKPEIFEKVKTILHFPQYCGYAINNQKVSEYTSIGCHTAMWDFDNMKYHEWLDDEEINLPRPIPNGTTYHSKIDGLKIKAGIGIHDSSASLAPYLLGTDEKFVLLSTGTWCINMNPFNYEPLTAEQLKKDCLSFLSINQKPVKSSRLFMGHIHDVNVAKITKHFGADINAYKTVEASEATIKKLLGKGVHFFANGIPENYIDGDIDLSSFDNFEEAYHQLMLDLTDLNIESLKLILPKKDDIAQLFVSGGFAKNEILVRYLATRMSDKKVYTSEVDNATAMGAALVVWNELSPKLPKLNLGLKQWKPFNL